MLYSALNYHLILNYSYIIYLLSWELELFFFSILMNNISLVNLLN